MTGTMQSLDDDEPREVLGEVLADQLGAILEYVQEIPSITRRLSNVEKTVDRIDSRLIIVERVVKEHEADLRTVKQRFPQLS